MNLTEIRLKHFKCFDDITIKCSKFTLLTGANSSGKTSVLHGLLGALQTKNFPLYYSPNGSYVSMGDFEELSYAHLADNPFSIELTFCDSEKNEHKVAGRYERNAKTKLPKLASLNFESPSFALKIEKEGVRFKANYSLRPEKDQWFQLMESSEYRSALANMLDAFPTKKQASKKRKEDLLKNLFHFSREGQFSFLDAKGLQKELNKPTSSFLVRQLEKMKGLTRNFENSFNFISSFRRPPERTYYQKTKAALKVDQYGDNYIDQILEWENENSICLKHLEKSLTKLQLLRSVNCQSYGGGRFELRVVPHASDLASSLCDVGFGVNQLLPILVADLQLGKGSTMVVSQPEIHLHPSIQASLAQHFAKQAKSSKKRYIFETHSEYFLNRLRLLITTGILAEEDVSVYYMMATKTGTKCYPITFCKNGRIEGAPKHFFDTYMLDVMDIAMNAQS